LEDIKSGTVHVQGNNDSSFNVVQCSPTPNYNQEVAFGHRMLFNNKGSDEQPGPLYHLKWVNSGGYESNGLLSLIVDLSTHFTVLGREP
jgi:hypothetical protein